MVSNKNRLYIALYSSSVKDGESNSYHWAFLVGPKYEYASHRGGSSHAVCETRNAHGGFEWAYQPKQLPNCQAPGGLLVRIEIAKIENLDALQTTMRRVPVVVPAEAAGEPDIGEDEQTLYGDVWPQRRLSDAEERALISMRYAWVRDVLDYLMRLKQNGVCRGLGTAVLDWYQIENLARNYVRKKEAAGRFEGCECCEGGGKTGAKGPRPTWDMLVGRELHP